MPKKDKKTKKLLNLISEIAETHVKQENTLISNTLKSLCRIYDAQYSFFNTIDRKSIEGKKIYKYCNIKNRLSFTTIKDLKDIKNYNWAMEKVSKGDVFYFNDIESLPDQAQAERKILKENSIASMIIVPVTNRMNSIKTLAIGNFGDDSILYKYETELLLLLANTLNNNIERLKSYKRLKKTAKRYSLLAKNAQDMVYRYRLWPERRFEYVNPAATRITGYTPSEHYKDPDLPLKIVYPDDKKILKRLYDGSVDFSRPLQIRWVHKDGHMFWNEERLRPTYDSKGRLIAIEGIARDITKRKEAEEKIEYLSFHDKLTGLYNRAYFDEELMRLDTKRSLPLSLIIADLNGLKLVNDVFGHLVGDELLKSCAACLQRCCRKDDIIARWGGDEFIMILPRTSKEKAIQIVKRIYGQCDKEKDKLDLVIPLSISIGISTKSSETEKSETVIKEAEDDMYRRKLKDKKENIETTIRSMKNSLIEKKLETKGHLERIKQNCIDLAKRLGFKKEMLDDMILLAEMHDIGKVSVFDNILKKSSKLTKQEWAIVKKHPEVGYRLVSSSNELISVAEYILGHHERWDGKGYPQGLRGENIPIYSRILAIADAYDIMTHETSYSKALTKEEALTELRKQSGSQFDPGLVKEFIDIMG